MFTRQPAARALDDIKTIDKTFERTLGALRPSQDPPGVPPRPGIDPMGYAGAEAIGDGDGQPIGSRQDGTFSIIGNDLTIVGQDLRIITRGTLQVEGKIEGDVVGNEVIIGEKGQVTGIVSGQNVIVHGTVAGTIKGVTVALKAGAHVDGDVLHHQLSVDQGAHLDGRVRRPADLAELTPSLD